MSNRYFFDLITGRELDIRAADADRERIAERLRQAHTEGRLDLTEFQQRLEQCYEAKTFGELRELVADLPRDDGHSRRSLGWRQPWRLVPLAPILIALFVISAAAGHHHHFFWVWIPLAFLAWRMSWWRRRRWAAAARRGPDQWL